MEKKNTAPVDAMTFASEAISVLPQVTAKTTLGELLELSEPPASLPSARSLWEEGGDPLADMNGCRLYRLYRSGLVIYYNKSGASVIWLPNCARFTYHFNKLRDSEKDYLKETLPLPDGFLAAQPWMIAVTLIGDHRVEANVMNRVGSKKGTVDLSTKDNGDKDDAMEQVVADPFRRAFNWYDGRIGENPLDAVERRETREEMLTAMTDKQREVFVMFYRDGMKQVDIAALLNVDQTTVRDRLRCALKKVRKFLV